MGINYTMEGKYTIKVEQYLNDKWVKILKTKIGPCTEEEAKIQMKNLQKYFLDYPVVELDDKVNGRYITITVANGPVRLSIRENYF